MAESKQLLGTHTALATPMANREVDYASLEKLIQTQLDAGIEGILAVGTTGESPTLSHEEHSEVVRKTVEFAKGKSLVVAGSGSNSTREAERLSREAQESGADALLLVAPYYNKPSQEGLFQHFDRVAEAVEIPDHSILHTWTMWYRHRCRYVRTTLRKTPSRACYQRSRWLVRESLTIAPEAW